MGNVTLGLCSSPHMVDLESSEDAQLSESTTLTMVSPPGVLPAAERRGACTTPPRRLVPAEERRGAFKFGTSTPSAPCLGTPRGLYDAWSPPRNAEGPVRRLHDDWSPPRGSVRCLLRRVLPTEERRGVSMAPPRGLDLADAGLRPFTAPQPRLVLGEENGVVGNAGPLNLPLASRCWRVTRSDCGRFFFQASMSLACGWDAPTVP